MEIPTFEQLVRIAPLSAIILTIIGLTAFSVLRIVQSHIESLKAIIKYLQEQIKYLQDIINK